MSTKSPVVAWIGIPRAPHIQDRKLWSLSIALSVAGFGLYALYKQEQVSEFSSKLRRAVRAGRSAVDVMTKLTEISQTVLSDVHLFLETEDDTAPVPRSLRQVTALLSTREFRTATRSLVMTFFEGLALSGGERTSLENQAVFENLVERIIVRATRRPDLLSIAVRLATRHAADELLQILNVLKTPMNGAGQRNRGTAPLDVLLSRVGTENGRRVMSTVVSAFTSTLVTVCIEKSRGVNTWDDVFHVISRPANLRVIQQLTGVSAKEFARSMIDTLADSRVQPRALACTEITADVDYSVQPSVCQTSLRHPQAERSTASEAVSNLVDSFVAVAHNEESRKVLYQFCGYAIAEVIKVLFLDFVNWFRQSVFADCLSFLLVLLFEFLLFCAVPLLHTYSTSLSNMQTYPAGE